MRAKKQILVICPLPERLAPGQRLKYEQYFDHFRTSGYEIVVSPFISEEFSKIVYKKGNFLKKIFWVLFGYARRFFDLLRLPFFDGVYIFLWVTPFGTTFFERLFRLASRNLIYDIDDLVYMGKTSSVNKIVSFLKGKKKPFYLMKSANHVITCTPYLDSIVRKYNSKTTDISSTINTDTYIPINRYTNDKPLVLGWSGSHSTSVYLHLLDSILLELQKRVKFHLLVIGDPDFKIEGVQLEAIEWREATEVRDLSRIDIGLYPLPNDPWVYGKSGLKALQYMALGIPPVAAAIGANFRVIEEGVSGFLVNSKEEWLDRLEQLMKSPELRRKIGVNARDRVEKYFSIKANEPTYLEIFNKVYGVPPLADAGISRSV